CELDVLTLLGGDGLVFAIHGDTQHTGVGAQLVVQIVFGNNTTKAGSLVTNLQGEAHTTGGVGRGRDFQTNHSTCGRVNTRYATVIDCCSDFRGGSTGAPGSGAAGSARLDI